MCLLRVCEARCGRALSGLLGRPPERQRACTPVLCLVNRAIVARSHSTMLSLPIWRAIQRLSLIGSDCSHSGQLGVLPPVQRVPALKPHGTAARLLQFLDRTRPARALRVLTFKQAWRDVHSHMWLCLQKAVRDGPSTFGAYIKMYVTVQTLSRQLTKTVFTEIKLPLSCLYFFMNVGFSTL